MLANTWDWIRLCGFLSYYFFTISAICGIIRKSAWLKSNKNLLFQLHTLAGWLGLFMLIGHMLILLIDSYMPFTLFDLFVPFLTDYETFGTSLGIIAFYCFAIVLYTSDVSIFNMKFPIWKKIHFIVFPAWVMSLVHAIIAGSDSQSPGVITFYVLSVVSIVVLLCLKNKGKARVQAATK